MTGRVHISPFSESILGERSAKVNMEGSPGVSP